MTQPFPIQPNDNRNPPKVTTQEDWLKHQRKEVKSLNVLAATPEQLKEAFRKL